MDGNFWEGPVSFSPFYLNDSSWTPGSTHNLDIVISPQLPLSWSIRYPWANWSDGGARNHNITLPVNSTVFTANFGSEYNVTTWANQGCAGQVTPTPVSPDGFYSKGSSVSFEQTTTPGWTFTGWLEDLTGTTNPKSLLMADERLVVANYNTSAKALSITSLTPGTKAAGQAGFTLSIKGAGFTPTSRIFVNNTFRTGTYVSATQLKVDIAAADIQNPRCFPSLCGQYPKRNLELCGLCSP